MSIVARLIIPISGICLIGLSTMWQPRQQRISITMSILFVMGAFYLVLTSYIPTLRTWTNLDVFFVSCMAQLTTLLAGHTLCARAAKHFPHRQHVVELLMRIIIPPIFCFTFVNYALYHWTPGTIALAVVVILLTTLQAALTALEIKVARSNYLIVIGSTAAKRREQVMRQIEGIWLEGRNASSSGKYEDRTEKEDDPGSSPEDEATLQRATPTHSNSPALTDTSKDAETEGGIEMHSNPMRPNYDDGDQTGKRDAPAFESRFVLAKFLEDCGAENFARNFFEEDVTLHDLLRHTKWPLDRQDEWMPKWSKPLRSSPLGSAFGFCDAAPSILYELIEKVGVKSVGKRVVLVRKLHEMRLFVEKQKFLIERETFIG